MALQSLLMGFSFFTKMEESRTEHKNLSGEMIKCNGSLLEIGENLYVILVNELKPFVSFELNKKEILKMINRIRSVERGLVKRELTQEEFILKDRILRLDRSLRSVQDLIALTMLPIDLKYLLQNKQITIRKALMELTKRKEENKIKKTSAYNYLISDIRGLLEVLKNECI